MPNAASGSTDEGAYLRKQKGRSTMTWVGVIVVVIVIIAVLGAGFYAGWFGKSSTSTSGGSGYTPPCASLTAAGSTFVYPLMAVWTTSYAGMACNANAGFSQVQVNYQAVGSGAGITDLTDKLVDVGASDAPLSSAQISALPAQTVTMPDSAGAVTIIYNIPKVTTGLNLTGPIIAAIYLGDITNWNNSAITAINPGVSIPSQAITVEHRSDGSGTTFAFSSYLSAENSTWKNSVGAATSLNWPTGQGQKGSEGVAGAVASTTGSIGYDELNYAEEEGVNVGIAKVLNPAGSYIMPTVADTASAVAAVTSFPAPTGNWTGFSIINEPGAGTYPIATLTYLMIYEDLGSAYSGSVTQAQAQALVSFLWWITHTGQQSATGLFYVPLPSAITAVDETAINEIVYNGAALTSH